MSEWAATNVDTWFLTVGLPNYGFMSVNSLPILLNFDFTKRWLLFYFLFSICLFIYTVKKTKGWIVQN